MNVEPSADDALRCALIVGHGRSGSNWVLSMLNASAQVHSRNEPHLLEGSPYPRLPDARRTVGEAGAMAEPWERFLRWSCERDGERDPRAFVRKDYERAWASRTGASNWPVRPKLRRALAVAAPALRRAEWTPRPLLVDRERHRSALHVLKLNDLRFWHAGWVLRERPEVPVVHLVRHPGGQLHSAWSRFFGQLDDAGRRAEEVVYRTALQASVDVAPGWRDVIGEIDRLDLDEAVMWFWRVNNEEIHRAGASSPNYRLVRYEDLIDAPLDVARELYDHVGVAWTPTAAEAVREGLDRSVWGPVSTSTRDLAGGWQRSLTAEQRQLVERVLADGPMASWW